jgi:hypothetical protein
MKKLIVLAGLALAASSAMAQSAESYIVKTKGVKKTEAKAVKEKADQEEEATGTDFVSQNFRYYSLCDWKDGMKFMVLPEKYDLIVNTFHDAGTGKEVASGKLRRKIMIYNNHSVGANGRERMNFTCQEDNKKYYFELPNGSFDDYCYSRQGVPTLAYLGDVDIAREKLIGQSLITRSTDYRIDVDYDSDSYEDVKVEKNMEVKVVAIGVGTRSFPVKIIVADKKGNEFYQNVALSKTNCGMRDDEFIVDNAKFLFYGSFDLLTGETKVSTDYAQYMGKTVYTKYATSMTTKGGGKDNRVVKVPKLMAFRIDGMAPVRNSNYVTLTLTETETGRTYAKDVTFINESVTGDIDGQKEDYFGYLFGFGEGRLRNTNAATRTMIREGRVGMGMTEEEVEMAVGEPDNKADLPNGRYQWIYKRTKAWLIVEFSKSGQVVGIKTPRRTEKSSGDSIEKQKTEEGRAFGAATETRASKMRAAETRPSAARAAGSHSTMPSSAGGGR